MPNKLTTCIALSLTLFLSNPSSAQDVVFDQAGPVARLGISMGSESFGHYRVEFSNDLLTWQTADAIGLVAGSGDWELTDEHLNQNAIFFRVVEDDSAESVLDLPQVPHDYETIEWPDHLATDDVGASDNTPVDNQVVDEIAVLGRVLFYDKKLSANYTVSCASCHQQEHGFSDPDTLSRGFDGGLTGRNSMGLANAQFYEPGHFFWDERADTLEDQVLEPIQNAVEMGLTLEEAISRVASYTYYDTLFMDAFGDSEVTGERIARALSQFVRSIVSTESKFDLGVASEFENFTTEERLGHELFQGRARCATCHEGPNFVGTRAENNGLEFPFIDQGVGAITGRERDMGKFKMSSLRNIEMTGPYMHDGRFATLEEVVDFYDSGVVENPNLGRPLIDQNDEVVRLNLTDREKTALVAFLRTLTDETVLTSAKWSDPFSENSQ